MPTFKGLPEETLIKIADVLEEYTYKEGQCIIRQVIDLKSVKFLTNLDNLDQKIGKCYQNILSGSHRRHILHHQRWPSEGDDEGGGQIMMTMMIMRITSMMVMMMMLIMMITRVIINW